MPEATQEENNSASDHHAQAGKLIAAGTKVMLIMKIAKLLAAPLAAILSGFALRSVMDSGAATNGGGGFILGLFCGLCCLQACLISESELKRHRASTSAKKSPA